MAESGTMAPPLDGVSAAGPGAAALATVACAADAIGPAAGSVPVVVTASAPAEVGNTAVAPTVGAGAAGPGAPAGAATVADAPAPVFGTEGVDPTTLLALMKIPFSESGLSWYLGSTSITTKY